MLGHGDYIYNPIENWGDFPDEITLGDVAGIAVDANDGVYLFNSCLLYTSDAADE